MKAQLNIHRLVSLLRLELYKARKGLLLVFVIAFGILFFVGLLLQILVENNRVFDSHEMNYAFTLLIGGFILSSQAFHDLGKSLRRQAFLTLPVSALERVLAMWFLTSLGWIVIFTTTYTLYTLLANSLGHWIFQFVTFVPFDPLGSFALATMQYYFVLQGLFLLGSASFRGYALPKTIAALLVIGLIALVLIYNLLKEAFMNGHECQGAECDLLQQAGSHTVWELAKLAFWWLLAPVTWVLTYLSISEQEG